MKGKIKRLFQNDYIFSVFAKVLGVVFAVVLSILNARYFGPELKGSYAIIENYVAIFAVFLGVGIYQAYPFYKKQDPCIFPSFVNNITSLFIVYQILAIAISYVLIAYFPQLKYLGIAVLYMPGNVYIKQLNYIVLMECPRRRNIGSIIISISEIFVLLFLIIFTEASFKFVLLCYTITFLISFGISFVNLKVNPLKIKFALADIVKYARFGFIPMLVLLCMTINYRVDITMLESYEFISKADIGIYATGVSLADKIWLIPDAVKDILLSKLVSGKKDEEEVAKIIRINLAICLLCVILLIVFGKPVIVLMYGSEFVGAYYVMLIMLIGVIGMIFYKMVYSYNISQGKRIVNLIILGGAAVMNIGANLVLIPMWGIYGAGVASIISYCLCGVAFLIYFHTKSKIPYRRILFVQRSDFRR